MKIFYFTATGNSLAVAKKLGGELISIPQVKGKHTFRDDVIGVVFPTYELLGEQGKTIDLQVLEAELSKIKGIGGKRLEEIMTVVEKFFDVE